MSIFDKGGNIVGKEKMLVKNVQTTKTKLDGD